MMTTTPQTQSERLCEHGEPHVIEVWYGKPPYYYVKKLSCRICMMERTVEEKKLR